MESDVRFALLSSGSSSSHLLQIGNVRILIDCGWDDRFDPSSLDAIANAIEVGIDAVILTHGDLAHAGALPHLISKRGLSIDCPIFSTLPVRRMAELLMKETCYSMHAITSNFTSLAFRLSDVSKSFSRHPNWVQLRFLQHFHIQHGKMAGISISPFNAGHALGGAMWKITLPDGSEILHAVDWCHRKERHLNGASLPDLPQRPFLLVASASGCLSPPIPSLKRDTELLEVVVSTLRGDGSVLVPVDAAGRMFEVLLLLEEFWAKEKMAYPLALISVTGLLVIDSAQQQVEWMSEHIQHVFGTKRENPLALKCTKILTNVSQINSLPSGPKVVLAFGQDFEYGPSRQLLFEWAEDPKNTICFIDRAKEGTLADKLQTQPSTYSPQDDKGGLDLELQRSSRVPLHGLELEQHYSKIAEAAAASISDPMQIDTGVIHPSGALVKVLEPMDEEEEEEEEERGEGAAEEGGVTAAASNTENGSLATFENTLDDDDRGDRMISMTGGTKHLVLMDGFIPPPGSTYPMFPDEDEAMVQLWDNYGLLPGPDDSWACHDDSIASQSIRQKVDLEAEAEARRLQEEREEREEEERLAGPPSKVVTITVRVRVRAAVRFFDYGGRADGPIIKKALEDAAPQNIVLVRGSLDERRDLSCHLSSSLSDLQCRVTAWDHEHEHEHQAPLIFHLPPSQMLFISDNLDAKLMGEGGKGMQRMQRYALAQVEAMVGAPDIHHPKMLQLLTAALSDTNGQDVFIVDSTSGIQLSLVKKALAEAGIEAVFQGAGTRLACGASGLVFVSRGGEDRAHLVMEGTVSEEYVKVREVVYRQFSVGASV